MTKLGIILQESSVEISQNFNTTPLCTYLETFDTFGAKVSKPKSKSKKANSKNPLKKWENKQRRKYTTNIIGNRCKEYELSIPKQERGEWNKKIARQYLPQLVIPELLPWESQPEFYEFKRNKYDEVIFAPTDEERQYGKYYNPYTNTGNQLRWVRLLKCHHTIKKFVDKTDNKEIYRATVKCNDKLCLICSQIRSRVAILKYQDKVNDLINPVMVVLHQRSPEMGELKQHIDSMYQDWRSICKVEAKSNRESMNGILALEITTNKESKTYHPHYHIIMEEAHAGKLMDDWIKKVAKRVSTTTETYIIQKGINKGQTRKRKVVNEKKRIKEEEEMRYAHTNKKTKKLYTDLEKDESGKVPIEELFKYAMKMSVTSHGENSGGPKEIASTEMIYEIAKALRGVQQWRPFGNFRETPNNKEIMQVIQDEMSVSRIDHPHIELNDEWIWNGCDWEAYGLRGMTLVGKPLDSGSIQFLRLTEKEYNTFVNENENRKNKFEQPPPYQNNLPPGVNEKIQKVFTRQTNRTSIHHHKQPEQ